MGIIVRVTYLVNADTALSILDTEPEMVMITKCFLLTLRPYSHPGRLCVRRLYIACRLPGNLFFSNPNHKLLTPSLVKIQYQLSQYYLIIHCKLLSNPNLNMTPLTMKLSGEAVIPKIAERAILDLEVASSNVSHQTSAEEVTSTAKEIQRLLKKYSPINMSEEAKSSAVIAKWSMGKMRTSSYIKKNEVFAAPITMHMAKVYFSIRIRDFTKIGMLANTFSHTRHVAIDRTHWVLTAQTRKAHKSELRKVAAADALQRAKDYADTLGLTKVRAVELSEASYNDGLVGWNTCRMGMQPRGQMQMQMQQMASMQQQQQIQSQSQQGSSDDDGVDLFFEPDEIQMSMSVNCKFEAE